VVDDERGGEKKRGHSPWNTSQKKANTGGGGRGGGGARGTGRRGKTRFGGESEGQVLTGGGGFKVQEGRREGGAMA